ncbi:hypothetical protein V5O48_009597 [Marasmius crinis-equi]|uniref:Uncharacterized protein n=1 Tax=Marasmius crinis-equi TaxID=585013 RepID=A0ABR3FAV3_9AGAR
MLTSVCTDENGEEITIPDPGIRHNVQCLQEALFRILWLNGRTRFHQERVKAYVEQTDQAAKELQAGLNSLINSLSTGLAHPSRQDNVQSMINTLTAHESNGSAPLELEDDQLSANNRSSESPRMPPNRAVTPEDFYEDDEDFYVDDEFDELARTVELTPQGGHVKLPGEPDEMDTSNVLGPLAENRKLK